MRALEPFLEIVGRLSKLESPFVVSGGVQAIVYGEPRLTNDIDLVLALERREIPRLAELFPADSYYTPPIEVLEIEVSRSSRGHFNIVSHHSSARADVYLPGTGLLERWAIAERHFLEIQGVQFPFAPLEYSIVKKLEFYRQGLSDRHLRDLGALWRISGTKIDESLLLGFLSERGLSELWQRAKSFPLEG